jgi:hypothetical protein
MAQATRPDPPLARLDSVELAELERNESVLERLWTAERRLAHYRALAAEAAGVVPPRPGDNERLLLVLDAARAHVLVYHGVLCACELCAALAALRTAFVVGLAVL